MAAIDVGRRARSALPQQWRLAAAIIYFVALLGLARYLNGQFWPPYGLEGLWFYSAAAALLVGEFVVEPFFTRPADAIANGLAVLIAAATVSLDGADISHHAASVGRLVVIVVAACVIALAVVAIAFKDAPGSRERIAEYATDIAGRAGRARWLFSGLLFAAGYAAFADSGSKIAALYLTWFTIIVLAPIESLFGLVRRRQEARPVTRGSVEGLDDPAIVIGRLSPGSVPDLGAKVEVGGGTHVKLGTIVELTQLTEEPRVRIVLDKPEPVALGSPIEVVGGEQDNPVVGHVIEGSSIEEVAVATVPLASTFGLEEGRLVEVQIGDTPTYYQVVGAEIVPRSEGDLRRHLVRVRGRKLGRWNSERTVFDQVAWVPAPGSAVRLLSLADAEHFDEASIGRVPGTVFGLRIDPHLAVTHDTAILGILGIGKTHLAWELMRRMLAEGIKAVALDITGRYCQHFADLCGAETQDAIETVIVDRIAANAANRNVRNDEAGNLDDFRTVTREVLDRFVQGDERLLILNPNRFEVTRMEGRPFQGQANMMARVTMVEVTRMIAEYLLQILQARPRDPTDESAALCLVLEEAHSLVPEWNSATNDAERQAVNGTARAVLQGRKYGYGCLVITQRTANVTKSILNQCNTVFGMRVYDATGMDFLGNYIGPTYSQLLASLRDRQAVVFGRASSCNSPLIVELNDSARFRESFWTQRGAAVPVTQAPADQTDDEQATGEEEPEDDDIPF